MFPFLIYANSNIISSGLNSQLHSTASLIYPCKGQITTSILNWTTFKKVIFQNKTFQSYPSNAPFPTKSGLSNEISGKVLD
jgi:hypothetical protein